jgi:hypothetical protein
MVSLSEPRAPGLSPSVGLPSFIWVVAGVFGLLAGGLLLMNTDPILGRLVWLAENYRTGVSSLSDERVAAVRQGIQVWGWSGIIVGAVTLPFWHPRTRSSLFSTFSRVANRLSHPLPLPVDRYGCTFLLAAGGVLVFTALTHWSLTAYEDVEWFEGEDGVSEWWSVATYLIAALLARATALRLRKTGHPWLVSLQFVLAGVLLIGALEEISWGQRLFNWGTPQALDAINQQGETTIHNVERLDSVISHLLFWGSVAGAGRWGRPRPLAPVGTGYQRRFRVAFSGLGARLAHDSGLAPERRLVAG